MLRRPNLAAEKAAANQQAIKSLLKMPGNRVCADCKRNKLPRWASWNLGIFICIRCSGIHRGMGTHISRVKSVDLDSWTDEQLQSMLKWGNNRANRYWEANLASGHVPSEAKIENFVRTKYESKRWVMEGGIPDPSTLEDEDDDNLPLRMVQKKLEDRQPSSPSPSVQNTNVDLISEDNGSSAPATNNVNRGFAYESTSSKPKPADSLLGLDFFAPSPAPSSRPSSAQSNPSTKSSSRPDLNRSILSLYASTPKAQQKAPPVAQSPIQSPSAFNDFNTAFEGLNFGTSTRPPQLSAPAKPAPFANLIANVAKSPASSQLSTQTFSLESKKPPTGNAGQSRIGDLFDFGSPGPAPAPAPGNPSSNFGSFDLPADANAWATTSATTPQNTTGSASSLTNLAFPGSLSTAPTAQHGASSSLNDDDWGSFNTVPSTSTKAVGSFGDDDLFGNVWK